MLWTTGNLIIGLFIHWGKSFDENRVKTSAFRGQLYQADGVTYCPMYIHVFSAISRPFTIDFGAQLVPMYAALVTNRHCHDSTQCTHLCCYYPQHDIISSLGKCMVPFSVGFFEFFFFFPSSFHFNWYFWLLVLGVNISSMSI